MTKEDHKIRGKQVFHIPFPESHLVPRDLDRQMNMTCGGASMTKIYRRTPKSMMFLSTKVSIGDRISADSFLDHQGI